VTQCEECGGTGTYTNRLLGEERPCPWCYRKRLIEQVREGLASARYAAAQLGITVDDVCIEAFGKVVL
jgi:hypothetical protein